jgi:hypothetical protein
LTSEAGTNEGTRRPFLRRYPPDRLALVLLGLGFLGYVGVRAWRLSITFDEAETFLLYIRAPLLAVLNVATANNHLLNTLLVRFFAAVGGPAEFVLRLPNLLGYSVYLWFSIKLVRTYVPRAFVIPGWLLLNLNPYLLDFFSLCRGYGLSVGLLLGSIFYFLEFHRFLPAGVPGRTRLLSKSLGLCAFAVLANFSVLNVFLGLVVWALAVMFVENASARRAMPPLTSEKVPRKRQILLAGVLSGAALVYNGVMAVQAVLVRPDLKKPVVVGLGGLDPEEKKAVLIYGIELGKLEQPFLPDGEGWKNGLPLAVRRIKIKIPAASWDKVQTLDVRIGTRLFSAGFADLQGWPMERINADVVLQTPASLSLPRSRLPVLREIINWDGPAVAGLCGRAALAAALVASAVLAAAAGLFRLLLRFRLYHRDQLRPVFGASLGLAAFVAYPLYILKKAGEFYYGGSTGFIHDTVYSLINDSLYGWFHGTLEQTILFPLIVASFVVGLFVFLRLLRSKGDGARSLVRAGLSLIAIIHLAALSVFLQHVFFNNPYLIGRTALFFIPLYMVFIVVLLAGFKRFGRRGPEAAAMLFVALAAVAVFHFGRTANFIQTADWRLDADTKTMVRDMAAWETQRAPERPFINLGIRWGDIATTNYYIVRFGRPRIVLYTEDAGMRYDQADAYFMASGPDLTEARLAGFGLRELKKYPTSEKELLVRIR